MPRCPTCKCIGKVIDDKTKATIKCPDCNGTGSVTDKMLEFIEYYKEIKHVRKEIDKIEESVDCINEKA